MNVCFLECTQFVWRCRFVKKKEFQKVEEPVINLGSNSHRNIPSHKAEYVLLKT